MEATLGVPPTALMRLFWVSILAVLIAGLPYQSGANAGLNLLDEGVCAQCACCLKTSSSIPATKAPHTLPAQICAGVVWAVLWGGNEVATQRENFGLANRSLEFSALVRRPSLPLYQRHCLYLL